MARNNSIGKRVTTLERNVAALTQISKELVRRSLRHDALVEKQNERLDNMLTEIHRQGNELRRQGDELHKQGERLDTVVRMLFRHIEGGD